MIINIVISFLSIRLHCKCVVVKQEHWQAMTHMTESKIVTIHLRKNITNHGFVFDGIEWTRGVNKSTTRLEKFDAAAQNTSLQTVEITNNNMNLIIWICKTKNCICFAQPINEKKANCQSEQKLNQVTLKINNNNYIHLNWWIITKQQVSMT